ncbi:hypothetical protein NDU88_003208 [Pleurodeles waltl]|uniref:Uncharacterized protein n=1 Tax=Pleurodeles waltl TaxID=8319 RepID=A0AAV7KVV5_PLEWA|nr:hypothetical protein NDU88_003208 [Pleurodeles waltl]
MLPLATSGSETALRGLTLGGPASFVQLGGCPELVEVVSTKVTYLPDSDTLREILATNAWSGVQNLDSKGGKDMLQGLVTEPGKAPCIASADTAGIIDMAAMAVKNPFYTLANYDQSQARICIEADAGDHFFSLSDQSDLTDEDYEATGGHHSRVLRGVYQVF